MNRIEEIVSGLYSPSHTGGWVTRSGCRARFVRILDPIRVDGARTQRRFLWAVETSPGSGCFDYSCYMEDGTIYQDGDIRGTDIMNASNSVNRGDIMQHCIVWSSSTAHMGSNSTRKKSPSYQAILDYGTDALCVLFNMMLTGPEDRWYLLIRDITGVDPVPTAFASTPKAIDAYWLKWGIDNGYISPNE